MVYAVKVGGHSVVNGIHFVRVMAKMKTATTMGLTPIALAVWLAVGSIVGCMKLLLSSMIIPQNYGAGGLIDLT